MALTPVETKLMKYAKSGDILLEVWTSFSALCNINVLNHPQACKAQCAWIINQCSRTLQKITLPQQKLQFQWRYITENKPIIQQLMTVIGMWQSLNSNSNLVDFGIFSQNLAGSLTDFGRIQICFMAQSNSSFSNTNRSENNNKD